MRKAMLLLAVFGLASSLWAADPLLGIWQLNLDKSNYGALPSPKSITRIFSVPREGEIQFTVDEVAASGTVFHIKWIGKCDGKDYPATSATDSGATDYDSAAVKRVSNASLEWTFKKGGKLFANATSVVSRDGKILTITWTGKNPQGDTLTVVHVYDKQPLKQPVPVK